MSKLIPKLSLVVALALANCAHDQMIPNTKIPDTSVNREVIEVIESYREAMEKRDAARVLMLVDPGYRDISGTPEPEDDIDYSRLKQILIDRFAHVKRVHYRMEYQNIELKGRDAWVDAWIDATFVYEQPHVLPRYRRLTDHQRFHLVKTGKGWRFLSGL